MKRYTNEEIFCVGSTYSRHHLKRKLINEGQVPYRCECGLDGLWQGKLLSLQIDHINGVSNDNRLSNLRFICPNCHSQTDTYAGKNSAGLRHKDKLKPNFKAEKLKRDREKLKAAKLDSTIRFGEWGWKTRLADFVGVSSQKIDKWLSRVDQT